MGKQLDKIKVQLSNATEKEAKRLVLGIHEELARTTPVDTGWARSNWLLSVGAPIEKTAGSKELIDLNAGGVGVGKILGWKFTQGPAYDTNNVPYIRKLNGGSSKQAAKNFVSLAIQKQVAISNRKKLG